MRILPSDRMSQNDQWATTAHPEEMHVYSEPELKTFCSSMRLKQY